LTAVCILRSSCRAGPTGTGRQSAGVSPTGRPAPRVCGWRGGTRPAIKGSDAPRGWPSRAPWTAWPRATQLRQRHSLPCRYRRSEGAFIESNREGGKSRTGQAKGSTMRGVCSGSGPGCGESWVLCRSKSSDKSEQAGGEGLAAREIRIVKGSWQSRRWSASAQRLKSSSSARPIPPPRESDQATRLDGRSVEVTEDPRSAALLPRFTASARRRRSGREGRIVSGRKRGGVAALAPRKEQRAGGRPSSRATGPVAAVASASRAVAVVLRARASGRRHSLPSHWSSTREYARRGQKQAELLPVDLVGCSDGRGLSALPLTLRAKHDGKPPTTEGTHSVSGAVERVRQSGPRRAGRGGGGRRVGRGRRRRGRVG
jgi:hypothetical protein